MVANFFQLKLRREYRWTECNYRGWNLAKTLALLFLLLQKYHRIFNGPEWPQLYVSFERWMLVIFYCLVNALLMAES